MTSKIKKSISFLSIFSLVFILSGCGGGGSSSNGATMDSSIEAEQTYKFANATTSLDIDSYRPYEISFQLTKGGFVQVDKSVKMKTFDTTYGTISSQNITTDENGMGLFTYNPPKIMPEYNSSYTIEYVYQVDDNTSNEITQTVTLNFKYNIVNENEKTTALSLVYMSTIPNDASGKITNRYRVHAVDKKSNQPRVGIPVTMSLINNAKIVQMNNNGTINKNTTNVTFEDTTKNFSKVLPEDNLIILPTQDRLDASYLGGWSVDSINSDTNLSLFETDTNLTTTNKLSYVIGDEVRLIGDQIAVADVINVDNETTTDEDGYIIFDVTFDPKLAGHTVTLEAHGDIDGQRIGVSQIASLRFDNISANDFVIDDMNGKDTNVNLQAVIDGGIETLSNLSLAPSSFHAVSSSTTASCSIDQNNSDYSTDKNGYVNLIVKTNEELDTDNNHVINRCTISWDGGMSSIYREYY